MGKIVADTIAKVAGELADSAADIAKTASKPEHATARHSSDMLSDNRLSKVVRPMIVIWCIAIFTAMLILNILGISIDTEFKSTVNLVMGLSVGFYFPARTVEKWLKKNSNPEDRDHV